MERECGHGEISVSVLGMSPCSPKSPQMGKATAAQHLPKSVQILVASGTFLGDVKSPASDL